MIRDSVVVLVSLHCLGCLNFDSLDWRIFMIRGGAGPIREGRVDGLLVDARVVFICSQG